MRLKLSGKPLGEEPSMEVLTIKKMKNPSAANWNASLDFHSSINIEILVVYLTFRYINTKITEKNKPTKLCNFPYFLSLSTNNEKD